MKYRFIHNNFNVRICKNPWSFMKRRWGLGKNGALTLRMAALLSSIWAMGRAAISWSSRGLKTGIAPTTWETTNSIWRSRWTTTMLRSKSIRKWAVSALKIRIWASTLSKTRMGIGWKLCRQIVIKKRATYSLFFILLKQVQLLCQNLLALAGAPASKKAEGSSQRKGEGSP